MHLHNNIYRLSELDFSDSYHLVTTATALLIAAGVAAATAVGTTAYSAHEERKSQKKMLDYQDEQVRKAEAKSAAAEALATQEAADKIKKMRLSQTRTILTSPLGINESADTSKPTLLGG